MCARGNGESGEARASGFVLRGVTRRGGVNGVLVPDRDQTPERRAPIGIVFGDYLSAMGMDDGTADGQAEAQSLFSKRHERFEDGISLIVRDANTTVGDGDLHEPVIRRCGH
jgi:hypothetical protein